MIIRDSINKFEKARAFPKKLHPPTKTLCPNTLPKTFMSLNTNILKKNFNGNKLMNVFSIQKLISVICVI